MTGPVYSGPAYSEIVYSEPVYSGPIYSGPTNPYTAATAIRFSQSRSQLVFEFNFKKPNNYNALN